MKKRSWFRLASLFHAIAFQTSSSITAIPVCYATIMI
jgi:hypothetical protein